MCLAGIRTPDKHLLEGTLDIDGFQDAFGVDGRQGRSLAKALQGQSTA